MGAPGSDQRETSVFARAKHDVRALQHIQRFANLMQRQCRSIAAHDQSGPEASLQQVIQTGAHALAQVGSALQTKPVSSGQPLECLARAITIEKDPGTGDGAESVPHFEDANTVELRSGSGIQGGS